jgi:hypothetical protein
MSSDDNDHRTPSWPFSSVEIYGFLPVRSGYKSSGRLCRSIGSPDGRSKMVKAWCGLMRCATHVEKCFGMLVIEVSSLRLGQAQRDVVSKLD